MYKHLKLWTTPEEIDYELLGNIDEFLCHNARENSDYFNS